jgi:Domain of unknown function (DUF1887)
MESHSIESLLKRRNAWLKSIHGDEKKARERAQLLQIIAQRYADFEKLRDHYFKTTDAYTRRDNADIDPEPTDNLDLVAAFRENQLIHMCEYGYWICDVSSKRFLAGGWLEELAWLAAMEAGADEASFGQVLGWKVKDFTGENEIDLIARKGERLCFVSCKAFRSELDMHDRKHRHRLMDAVHEADNLVDHFGRGGEKVAVLVTTDLFDEIKNSPRYLALMGKAAVLDVKLIALEDLGWNKLVGAMRDLLMPEELT